jgi:hypothetical protein
MVALSALTSRFMAWVGVEAKPLSEPEAINAVARPMTGLFAQLTKAQQKVVLAYRGEEGHGDPSFLKR